ncbi:class I SAM-dependent methyltransferase [Aspergillus saccharolyticus JOP 1030-1]|uniref:S-adenosyl-L-methionine-dependent methyltransferase n=1 Tax=Aspergillus saccharolyticus JOP 1030-1 TaxID=1450539 RepID=A0A318Z098_9EURO|nr:S-adenosyl-L-methionine-dependent methyltransferase [Aspergillus saccharolyticus JOP 1030-1]PYH40329.1 S-adenosyl-L-methionine-dependent methyltransferase [Aspergillus saccharolyticus JOP 1030-1]
MTTQTPSTWQWIQGLLEPGQILSMAMKSYLHVCIEAIVRDGHILAPILDTQRLRNEAFGRFWLAFSAPPSQIPPAQQPVQQQPQQPQQVPPRITGSADLIPPLLATATGLTLDIGPGTGTQIPHLRSPAITALYGVEPCHPLHDALRARATAEGVGEKYTVLGCSVAPAQLLPALEQAGLSTAGDGVFDTILCVRVLCSVPDLEGTVQGLYRLLKPGGRVIVVEHVVSAWSRGKGSLVARVMQGVYEMLGWRWFVGDCCLTRDTEKVLRMAAREDGGWERVELERYFADGVLPYVAGVLVKKGGETREVGVEQEGVLRRR